MKPVSNMTFREQLGAAAKYGAYSQRFQTSGFRASGVDGESVSLSPEVLESWIDQFSEREIEPTLRTLVQGQPMGWLLTGWTELDLLKLRAHLTLRLGTARHLSESMKNLALVRSYPREAALRGGVDGSPYRDDSSAFRLTRGEKAQLLSDIAARIEAGLTPTNASDAVAMRDVPKGVSSAAARDDFMILHAYDLWTFPATTADKLQVAKSVTVRALRDEVPEYRYTAQIVTKGAGAPELELLGGPGAHFERLAARTQAGVPGFDYQIVIPFRTPMKAGEQRTFSWVIRNPVDERFFEPGSSTRVYGFRPSRELLSARMAIQFAHGAAPKLVGVVTNARIEDMDIFAPEGETLEVVDDYVEKTWSNPAIARYCNLVWPR